MGIIIGAPCPPSPIPSTLGTIGAGTATGTKAGDLIVREQDDTGVMWIAGMTGICECWQTWLKHSVLGMIVSCLIAALAMGGCSWWLIGLQKYKNEIYGPWDPARPIIISRRYYDDE